MENEKRWNSFLYGVEPRHNQSTQNIKIKTKTMTDCLANDFANQLLDNHGGDVPVYAQTSSIGRELGGFCGSSENENYTDWAWSSERTHDELIGRGSSENETYMDEARIDEAEEFLLPSVNIKPNVELFGNGGNENYIDGAKIDEARESVLSSSDNKHIKDDIEINRSRVRDKSKKSDIDKPCSKWTISEIAKYFDFDECVRRISTDLPFPMPETIVPDLLKDINARIDVLQDITNAGSYETDSFFSGLNAILSNETGSRLVIDAFLIPLCSKLNLTIKLEININCSYLPNCIFDYCIYEDNKIIGCVEAKSPSTLNKKAIAQAIVQLNVLQILRITNKQETSSDINLPIFCIITDGFRFIFIQLIGKCLHFQIDAYKNKLHINEIINADVINQVVYDIAELIGKSMKNVRNTTRIAEVE